MNFNESELASLPADLRRRFMAARARLLAGDARTALGHALAMMQQYSDFAAGWHLLGVAALQSGDARLALQALEKGVALAPQDPDLLGNLAAAYLRTMRYGEAERIAQKVQTLLPQRASAYLNRSTALQALGRLDEAITEAETALKLDRERPEVWNNLGNLYKEQGRLGEALAAYDTALDLNPNLREALSNKLAALKLDPRQTPASLLAAHREYSRRYEYPLLARYQPTQRDADPERPLRVGYVSPDCHGAVPAFIHPVLRAHDRERFSVYCYYNNPQPPELEAGLAADVIARVLRGRSDEEVAAQIRADQIDLLIDIAGHTGKNRLGVFMLRPAPIQISWLDYLGTTGLLSMDYRLTDAEADPPGMGEEGHSETLLRLPHPQWCWEPPKDPPEPLPAPGEQSPWLSLGSFNNYSKLTDATLALWAEVLQSVSTARLLVVGVAEGAARRRIETALGVGRERLAFLPRLDEAGYRRAFAEVDLALDPLPFSGATTTLDALWQGVPVLTLPGATSASRSSASILRALGLVQWIACDAAAYVASVQTLAQDCRVLSVLRRDLRSRLQASSLTDAGLFTRHLEACYREVWRAWCQASPQPFSFAPRPRAAPTAARWREADLALAQARELLARGELSASVQALTELLHVHQNWTLAQQLLASAAMAWAQQNPSCLDDLRPPLMVPAESQRVSIIVCSIDENKLAAASQSYATQFAGLPHEIIAIRDARSLSEGFNRGARQAKGEILIFSHDDVLALGEDFAPRLLAHLQRWDGIGVCGTSRLVSANWGHSAQPDLHGHILHQPPGEPGLVLLAAGCVAQVHAVEAVDGVFFAVRRAVWEAAPYDEETFDGFHLYDVDFSWRASQAGFRLGVPLDLSLLHRSTGSYGAAWRKYARRFEAKYAAQLAPSREAIPGSVHCKVKSFEQARLLLAGLFHFRYGAVPAGESSGGQS